MGKRSNFERVEKDFYRTIDPRAVAALAPHLVPNTRFAEPCAGAGDLMDQLVALGHVCARARDIAPQRDDIEQKDALTTLTGNIDWAHTVHEVVAAKYGVKTVPELMTRCVKIVSVGRLIWIPGTTTSGKDNCAWYLFDARHDGQTEFVGR